MIMFLSFTFRVESADIHFPPKKSQLIAVKNKKLNLKKIRKSEIMATANPTDKSTFHKVSDSMAEKVANLTRTFQAMERSSKESSEKPKSELLKMVATEKGIGYVALKNIKIGTLILDEKPQIFTEGTAPESKFFKSLSESFKNLQLDDQEKYSSVPNRRACTFINFEKKIPPVRTYLGLHV